MHVDASNFWQLLVFVFVSFCGYSNLSTNAAVGTVDLPAEPTDKAEVVVCMNPESSSSAFLGWESIYESTQILYIT